MTPQIEEAVEALLRLRREYNAVAEAAKTASEKHGELARRRDALSGDLHKLEREFRELIVEEATRD